MYSSRRERSVFIYIIPAVLVLLAVFLIYKSGRRNAIPGLPDPVQTEEKGHIDRTIGDWKLSIDYDYSYEIEALVLHTMNYPETGIDGKLSPKDLALAWGSVAAYNKAIDFHWGQSGRWYHWYVDSYAEAAPVCLPGLDPEVSVSIQSANNHIIPADRSVRSVINRIRRGDHVKLKGYLVNIKGMTGPFTF